MRKPTAALDQDGQLIDARLGERFEQTIVGFMDLFAQMEDFLGHPSPGLSGGRSTNASTPTAWALSQPELAKLATAALTPDGVTALGRKRHELRRAHRRIGTIGMSPAGVRGVIRLRGGPADSSVGDGWHGRVLVGRTRSSRVLAELATGLLGHVR